MTTEDLRSRQAPLKACYKDDPSAAQWILKAEGTLQTDNLACSIKTTCGPIVAGLHPATGGDGSLACSGDMLLQSLVACAGVTLQAVATAMSIPLRGGTVSAEGDLDFSGTLGVRKDVPVGFKSIRLNFRLDTDATAEQLATLLKLTERFCVIYQTLKNPASITATIE